MLVRDSEAGDVNRPGSEGRASQRHFSMIRYFHLADLFTLANGCCGTAAIFFAMAYMRQEAAEKVYAARRARGSGPGL